MTNSIIIGLVHNAALLVTLVYLYSVLVAPRRPTSPWQQLQVGVLVGSIGVAIMLTRWELEPGVAFDTRSVLLGISGLFLGTIPTITAIICTGLLRLSQGGAGMMSGLSIIVISGLVGLAWRHHRQRALSSLAWRELLLFGVVIHVIMLALLFLMPLELALRVVRTIALPVLLIYPIATVLIGLMMAHSLKSIETTAERERTAESIRKLSAVVEQSPACVVITDLEGTIEYVNPKFTEVTGYTAGEVVGQNPRVLKSGRNPPEIYEDLWNTITHGGVWQGELHNRKKDGTLFWERASISPIFAEDGSILRFLAIKEDITEQKHLADQFRQAQKMEAIGRLAGGVAHDFNNKLQAILGSAEIALEDAHIPAPIREALTDIKQAAERSADLTRQLLTFARKQAYQPRVIDLNETISSMIKMLQRLIGSHIEMHWLPGQDIGKVKLDPSQLDQILANLVVNSRDAIQALGTVTIETRNVHLDRPRLIRDFTLQAGDYVTVIVSDTGCGMTREVMDNIFDPYFTTKQIGEGTGLGLPTVYGVMQQNNGAIHVESQVDVGTTVTLYFPRTADASRSTENDSKTQPQTGTETILVTEDDSAILELAANMLRKFGYHVLTARNPKDALALTGDHEKAIDLLLTDVVMPGSDGRTLATELRRRLPDIKVLYMSGYTADVIAKHGLLEEDIDFLQKPFSIHSLNTKVREILDRE